MKDFLRTMKKMPWTAKFSFIVVIVWVFFAIFTDFLEPFDPTKVDITKRLFPPSWCEGGNAEHFLGTDEVGRDVLSRLMHGSRLSIIVGIMAVAVSLAIGMSLGLIAGFFGGKVDAVIMRIVDMMLSFPFIFLALCFMAVLGSSLFNVILVLGITGWVPYARTIRASVLALKKREFIVAATTLGSSPFRILVKHLIPNVIDTAIVLGTMEMGSSIISEASLTFLGMGVPVSIPTWGQMIATGREYIFKSWWLCLFPGIAVFLVVLAVNFIGDYMRDMRDPKLKSSD